MNWSRNAICDSRCRLSLPIAVRRRIGDALAVAGGLMIVVCTLVATSDEIRERATILLSGGKPLVGLSDAGARVGDLGRMVLQVTMVFSRGHSFWTISALVAVVLLAAVFRL
jgi:hypothetical protein